MSHSWYSIGNFIGKHLFPVLILNQFRMLLVHLVHNAISDSEIPIDNPI